MTYHIHALTCQISLCSTTHSMPDSHFSEPFDPFLQVTNRPVDMILVIILTVITLNSERKIKIQIVQASALPLILSLNLTSVSFAKPGV